MFINNLKLSLNRCKNWNANSIFTILSKAHSKTITVLYVLIVCSFLVGFVSAQDTTTSNDQQTANDTQNNEVTTDKNNTTANDESINVEGQDIKLDETLLEDNFYYDLDENLNSGVPPVDPTEPETPKQPKNPRDFINIQISNVIYPVTRPQDKRYIYVTNVVIKEVVQTNTVLKVATNFIQQTNVVTITNVQKELPYVDLGYEFVRVRRMISSRQYEQAIILLNQLGLASPRNTRIYNMRGSVYYKLGFYNYAISNWNKSLEINPNQQLVRRYIERLKTNTLFREGTVGAPPPSQ